jgi:hypothetical protein
METFLAFCSFRKEAGMKYNQAVKHLSSLRAAVSTRMEQQNPGLLVKCSFSAQVFFGSFSLSSVSA